LGSEALHLPRRNRRSSLAHPRLPRPLQGLKLAA
jgi:hypothetical protein